MWPSLALLAFALVSEACNPQVDGSPEPSQAVPPYPIGVSSPPYPAPLQQETGTPVLANAVPFRLNRPIIEGSKSVSGVGPPGVPIRIQDVTFMGTLLGETTIAADGTFQITVEPLEVGHRIGVSLGDFTGTEWRTEEFQSPAYHGPEAMQVPQVGFFHDTASVQAK